MRPAASDPHRAAVVAAAGVASVASSCFFTRRDVRVIGGRQTEEDAAARAAQRIGRHACVLERAPSHLEDEPVLRVHRYGLAWDDPEQTGVERIDSVAVPR